MINDALFIFSSLADLFASYGHTLLLVGGTVRDYLLDIPLTDMDAATSATPLEMKQFIPDADFTFEKFGSVKLIYQGLKFDITTFRKEDSYLDSRHPSQIIFVRDYKEDVKRRDLTFNGLYLDKNLHVFDEVGGVDDIKNKTIRMIGDPLIRIKEDPLRILRIIRFSLDLSFTIDPSLEKILKNNVCLLEKLQKEKIYQEISKIKTTDINKKNEIFRYFNISIYLKVIK